MIRRPFKILRERRGVRYDAEYRKTLDAAIALAERHMRESRDLLGADEVIILSRGEELNKGRRAWQPVYYSWDEVRRFKRGKKQQV